MAKGKTKGSDGASGVPAGSTGASAASAGAASDFVDQQTKLVGRLLAAYLETTPQTLKLIDSYLVCVMLTGIIQFLYVILAGTFPYNSFLSGFIASVGAFVLAANLRIQLNRKNDFGSLSPEAAFAEYAFSSAIFYGFVVNYLG
ncbi:Dolichyl-diphosphooligosaccharide-protein glycosyltransferase subunit dad1 [Cladochytrium tenue]|nr:Dolichyl-diphosphooligosaccharide-protein glycosyltransferase subunit dad1 [Cladochytrium tenue]